MTGRFEARYEFDGGRITAIEVGTFENITYVVECGRTGRALVVDAAAQPARVLEALEGLELEAIVTTHGHADHHGAALAVERATDAPVLLHPADARLAPDLETTALSVGPIAVGSVEVQVFETPGHTPGSVCLAVPGHLFTGDTLFPGGPGATRWDYSDFDQIIASIDSILFAHPDETAVHPGHGLPTTIGRERPQLPVWVARGW